MKLTDVTISPLNYQDVNAFAQRLSDFTNGVELKKQILNLGSGIVGYCWREQNHPDGLTYCFVDSTCMTPPFTECINI